MLEYEEIEHTADWMIRIEDRTLAGLFNRAVRSMLHMAGARAEEKDLNQRRVSIETADLPSLLVEWLQEWIYLLEAEGRVPVEFNQLEFSGARLEAIVTDAPIQSLQKHIKAATYHGLRLEELPQSFVAEIVFDV